MFLHFLRKKELLTKPWSGGKTTELYIYPPGSEYTKRNFLYRISTATIETEQSTFTLLPGIRRKLMILDGSLTITHQNKYTKTLNKFDADEFNGDWQTSARGKVTDFNLMLIGNTIGSIENFILSKGNQKEILPRKNHFTGIYFYKGSAHLENESEHLFAEEGDFIMIEGKQNEKDTLFLKAETDCELILVRIDR